jgi:hypothetical protein
VRSAIPSLPALEPTRRTDFDLALLDADLQGQSVWPVADALVARDIGFIFVTGSDHGLFAYRDRPTLKKPFQIDALKRCCRSVLSPPAAGTLKAHHALGYLHRPGAIQRKPGRQGLRFHRNSRCPM